MGVTRRNPQTRAEHAHSRQKGCSEIKPICLWADGANHYTSVPATSIVLVYDLIEINNVNLSYQYLNRFVRPHSACDK